jgi:hypothetical protein
MRILKVFIRGDQNLQNLEFAKFSQDFRFCEMGAEFSEFMNLPPTKSGQAELIRVAGFQQKFYLF